MLKRRILKLTVAMIFVAGPAGGLAVAGSGTALAATTAASQAVTPALAQAPAVTQCPLILHRFTTYYPTCATVSGSRTCSIGNQGNFAQFPAYADNGCIYRVWLYSERNEAGATLCLSPRSGTGYMPTEWMSFRIVSNQNNC